MCKFYSAIVLKNGDIIHNPWTTSHQDLIEEFNINDNNGYTQRFVKIEFYPEDQNDIDDETKYVLRVDENETPDWFTEIIDSVTEKMMVIIKNMIIKNQTLKVLTGKCIILSNSKVDKMIASKCYVMKSSNVGEMRESSNVGEMWGSSNVGEMWGSSNVGEMWGRSNVGEMRESSNVGEMRGSSNVTTDYREKK